jgi:uncharacterized protein
MDKVKRLKRILQRMRSVLIAYSGGADSTFLLKVAVSALGHDNVLAVTAKSPTYPASELKDARQQAKKIGARHIIIATKELGDARFAANPADRCYYCKSELFRKLKRIAKKQNIRFVIDASNKDDLADYRPGSKAKKELRVASPLQEAGLGKADIRRFSRKLGLATWDKPAMACLASRLPYGERITLDNLKKIEKAEDFLQRLGFRRVRVRCHGRVARIEAEQKDIAKLGAPNVRDKIAKRLKQLGFLYIALDLEGYRTGSLNEALQSPRRLLRAFSPRNSG